MASIDSISESAPIDIEVSGAQGPRGPAGPNSVTSATTSDGSANLSLAAATVSGLLTAGHIHGNLAGTLYTHVRTGEAMSKGDPFYISGFHVGSSQPIAMRADANDAAKMPAIGVMDADYAANTSSANGIISGTLSSINTAGYTANSPIFVADGGGYSNNTGRIPQQIGITERANASTGAFIVSNVTTHPYFSDVTIATDGALQISNGSGAAYLRAGLTTDVRDFDLPDESGTILLAEQLTNGTANLDISSLIVGGLDIAEEIQDINDYLTSQPWAPRLITGVGPHQAVNGEELVLYNLSTAARINDPAGLTAGHQYKVTVVAGSFQFNGTGTTFYTTRLSVIRACNGSAWLTLPYTFDEAVTFNSTSYTFGTGAAAALNTATGEIRKYKATDETRTTATLTLDADLRHAVDANGVYAFEIQLYLQATGAATFQHGIYFDGTLANTTAAERFGMLQSFLGSTVNAALAWSSVSPPTCLFSPTGSPTGWILRYSGVLQVATAGTFGPYYSNAAASGTIVMQSGSYMILNKLNV